MPRGPIIYSLPAGTTPKNPLDVVPSGGWNGVFNDIANTFNTAQPIAYGGTGGTSVITGHDGLVVNGADIPTASTLVLSTATGPLIDLTGTTTVTAVTLAQGQLRITRAAGDFQITVGASLIGNSGGANVNVKAGDLIIWEGYAAGVVRFWVVPVSGQANVSLPARGYIHGVTLSNNSADPINDIDVAAGAAADSTNAQILTLLSTMTKQLDVAWSAGSGAGGRMSPAAIANTTYHVFLIKRIDTGAVDVGFDTSPTTPTLPANYTLFRRIGSIVRSGGGIGAFIQRGNTFLWLSPIPDINVNNQGTAAVLYTLSVPSGLQVEAILIEILFRQSGTGQYASYTSSPLVADIAPALTVLSTQGVTGPSGAAVSTGEHRIFTDTSSRVRSRLSLSDATIFISLTTLGWNDLRGTMS